MPPRGLGGFSIPRLGIEAVPLGAETADQDALDAARAKGLPYPPILAPLSPEQLAQVRSFPSFKDAANDAEIMAQVTGIRVMVLSAIAGLGREDPMIAGYLKRLYRKGLICLGTARGRPVAASLANDTASDFDLQPINLYHYPCGEVPYYDSDFFRLVNFLAGEAYFSLQAHYLAADPDNPDERPKFLLVRYGVEVDAYASELRRVRELDGVLESIINLGLVPDSAHGLTAWIGAALLNDPGLTAIQRIAAAQKLRDYLAELNSEVSWNLAYRQTYKRSLELYFQAGVNRIGTYNSAIQESGWYRKTSYHELPGIGKYRITYNAGGGRFEDGPGGVATRFVPNNEFAQFSTRGFSDRFMVPGRSISDCYKIPNGNRLLIAGTDSTGVGLVWGVEDTNNDGFYDRASLKELLRGTDLGGGLRWAWDSTEMNLLGVNRRTANVYSFPLPADGGFPSQMVAAGSLDPRGDLMDFWVRDGSLYGATDLGSPLSAFDIYAVSQRTQTGGTFVPTQPYFPRADSWYRPALNQLPFVGASFLDVKAVPNSTVEAFAHNPDGTSSSLGSGKSDWTGSLSIKLNHKLELGYNVRFTDYQARRDSVPEPVETPRESLTLGLTLLRGEGEKLALGYRYKPFENVNVAYSEHLDDWEPLFDVPLGGFGWKASVIGRPAIVAGYFRTMDLPRPALQTQPDQYVSGPGLTLRANVLANDTAPAGTRVVLDEGPPVHVDLFTWHGNGSFTLTAPITGPSTVRFKYHLERDDGTRSATVTVDISLAFTGLTSFVQRTGADGRGMYQVPCLYLPSASPLGMRRLPRPFPMYQFRLANNPQDVCKEPHWHSHTVVFSLLIPLEILTGIPGGFQSDPNPGSCGFGRFSEVPLGIVSVPVAYWEQFLKLNPPVP